jgi:nicotinate-nucleotide pyrophosphorylase (carboxylating)
MLPKQLPFLSEESINDFIRRALEEDLGDGDHSSYGTIPEENRQTAELIIKDDGILAGVELARRIFQFTDRQLEVEVMIEDGQPIEKGNRAFMVTGSTRAILGAERLVLNCMQRMSGIATYTYKMSQLIRGTNAKLLDTRKTTPNFRLPEKWAVAIGGGVNHRFGLYDMVMLKDNHVDFAGGIEKAIRSTAQYLEKAGKKLKIEIEVRNLRELEEVMSVGRIDRIMLDNMLPSEVKRSVEMIGGRYETEASGGITEKNIAEFAQTGVDFISVGALTHSYQSLDMSLKAVNN